MKKPTRNIALFVATCFIASAIALIVVKNRQDPNRLVDAGKIGRHTVLIVAVKNGDAEEVRRLLDRGADVNKPGAVGITPVIMAVDRGRYKIADILILEGADVNCVRRDFENVLSILLSNGEAGRPEHYRLFLDILEKTKNVLSQDGIAVEVAVRYDLPLYLSDLLRSVEDPKERERVSLYVMSNFEAWGENISHECREVLSQYTGLN